MRRRFYKSAAAFENVRRQKTVLPFCRCSTEKYEVAGNLKIKRQNAVEKVNIYPENYIEKFFGRCYYIRAQGSLRRLKA